MDPLASSLTTPDSTTLAKHSFHFSFWTASPEHIHMNYSLTYSKSWLKCHFPREDFPDHPTVLELPGNAILQWRRQWQPTLVLLPGKSQGQRSLVGCCLWGREELNMTDQLHFHFSLSCIGEGNGNPLQCSCLENPRDSGAWWASVYGVAESDTIEAT